MNCVQMGAWGLLGLCGQYWTGERGRWRWRSVLEVKANYSSGMGMKKLGDAGGPISSNLRRGVFAPGSWSPPFI